MKINIELIFFVLVNFILVGCKSIISRKYKFQTNSYYEIKDRYIDNSLPDSIAIIEGNVFVVFIRSTDEIGKVSIDTAYTCGGSVYDRYNKSYDNFIGCKYGLKLPIQNTELIFKDFCTLTGPYLTEPIILNKQEKIVLDVVIRVEKDIYDYNRDEPILMREMK